MARMPHRFDTRCPCKQDCSHRSAECRKDCAAYAEYEAIKRAEYEARTKAALDRHAKYAYTAARARRMSKTERDIREGRL